jgi:hypothetical protein
MTRIELDEIACDPCGNAQKPKRFTASCPACGQDRFHVRVRRTVKGFDRGFEPENIVYPFLSLMLGGDLGLIAYAVNEGAAALNPYHSWSSTDDLEGLSGTEISEFLSRPESGRRSLYLYWKRKRVEAGLTENRGACRRCDLIFAPYANRWHREGYCSRKCFETDALSQRSKR